MTARHRPLAPYHALVLLVLVLAAATGCRGDRPGDGTDGTGAPANALAEPGGTAVICAQALPEALNPFVTPDQLAADLRMLLYTPLVLYDGDAGFRPYLAREWTWNDDHTRLRFTLRDDVRWHDDTPLTAADVAWTIDIARDSRYAYAADLTGISAVRTTGTNAVDIEFERPFTEELEPFVSLPILPRHLLADVEPDAFARAEYQRAPVGSGPYRFAGRGSDGLLNFARFDAFPAELGRGNLDRIVFRGVSEASTLLVELQTGGVDLCVTGASLARQLDAAREVRALSVAPAGVQVIPLDTRQPPFDDARVRRAVSAALRRNEIAGIVSPLATPATTFMPASNRFLDPALAQPDSDSTQAALLLDEAGYATVGADGIRRNAAGQPLRFTLVATPALEAPLVVFQAQLRRLGVDVELRFMEGASFISTIRDPQRRPPAMALAFFPGRLLQPDPFAQLHSTGSSNLASYNSVTVDSLVMELRRVVEPERRGDLYRELQRRVAEDVPTLYTLYIPRLAAVGPRLEGVMVDLNGPFSSVSKWWIPAERRR